MECPKCQREHLHAQELEHGLIAAWCESCEGALVPLMNYRYWVEGRFWAEDEFADEKAIDVPAAEDTEQAVPCAKCERLMIKYRIGLETPNRIDLCANCDEVWLDKNEWELLKSLRIHHQLPAIVSDVWQRKLRRRRQNQLLQERFRTILGEEDLTTVNDFKTWLEQHPRREQIKQYLVAAL